MCSSECDAGEEKNEWSHTVRIKNLEHRLLTVAYERTLEFIIRMYSDGMFKIAVQGKPQRKRKKERSEIWWM